MPRNNQKSKSPIKSHKSNNNISKPVNNLPNNQNTNNGSNIMNTVKDAVVYSIVFNGTSRIFDSIFGGRKVEVEHINNNNNNNNTTNDIKCDDIIKKYNESHNRELYDFYEICMNKKNN